MDDIQKLYSDIKRIIKHDRAHNDGMYNGERASKAVADYFSSLYRELGNLPAEIAGYWLKRCIFSSQNPETEPSEKSISWLLNAADILNGTYTGENDTDFSQSDWKELREIINYEAEQLPIDTLTELMSILMSKNVL
ncbi:hypothetical protein H0R92_12615 [Treponema sp. OMZ 840]|uniref:hypothetical protein n=1 Tax=Treponema sp. OMZ 840 TaxID=244313 RepID=UPI003D8D9377